MSVDIGLDLSVLEGLDFDFAPPCEGTGHDAGIHHGGPAVWYVTYRCAACGAGRSLTARCAPRVEFIENSGGGWFSCQKCWHTNIIGLAGVVWRKEPIRSA